MNRILLFIGVVMLLVLGALFAWWAFQLPGEVVVRDATGELISFKSWLAALIMLILGGGIAIA